jgi:hypothetical protein
MVAMPDVVAVRVYGNHRGGLMQTNLPYQLFSELGAVLQALVGEAQKYYLSNAQNSGGFALFFFTYHGEICRLDVAITRPFVSIRTDYQYNLAPLLRPARNSATCPTFGIIRMRSDNQHWRHLLHQSIPSFARCNLVVRSTAAIAPCREQRLDCGGSAALMACCSILPGEWSRQGDSG